MENCAVTILKKDVAAVVLDYVLIVQGIKNAWSPLIQDEKSYLIKEMDPKTVL